MNSTARVSTPPKRSADDDSGESHADKRGRHEAEVRTMPSADETRGTCTCDHPDLPEDTSQADTVPERHIEVNGSHYMRGYRVGVKDIDRPLDPGYTIEENAAELAVTTVGALLSECNLRNIHHIDELVRDAPGAIRQIATTIAAVRNEELIPCNLEGAADDELPRYHYYVAKAATAKVNNPVLDCIIEEIPNLEAFMCSEANSLADVLVAVLTRRELNQFKTAVRNPDSLDVDPENTTVAVLVQVDPTTNETRLDYTDTAVVKLVGMTDHPVVKAFVETLDRTEEDEDDN